MKRFHAVLSVTLLLQAVGAEESHSVSPESLDWAHEWCHVCCNVLESGRAERIDEALLLRKPSCTTRCSKEILCEQLDGHECRGSGSTKLKTQVSLSDVFDSFLACSTLGSHARSTLGEEGAKTNEKARI